MTEKEIVYTLDLERELGGVTNRKFMYLKDGENIIRFLPPYDAERIAFLRTYVHYGIGTNPGFVFCPRYMAKLPCPICEHAEGLIGKGYDKSSDEVRRLLAKQRYLSNVVDLNFKEDGVKVLIYPRLVYDGLLNILRDTQNFGDFTHYKTGFPIKITRSRSGVAIHMRTYSVIPLPQRGPVDPSWLKGMYNLKKVAELKPYEELRFLLLQALEAKDITLHEEAPATQKVENDDFPFGNAYEFIDRFLE